MSVRSALLAALFCLFAVVDARADAPGNVPNEPKVSAKRPVTDFATLPFMEGPELSPDGKRIAARLAVNGTQMLAVIELIGGKPPALVGLGDNDLLEWHWVNDGWLAVRIGNESLFEAEPIYLTRVAGVSADGKTVKPIAFREGGQSADILWTADDGTPRILMAMQKSIYLNADFWPSVSEVDVSTGRSRPKQGGMSGVFNWYPDTTGAIRMGIGVGDNGRSARLLYRPAGTGSFRTVDRADFRKREELSLPILLPGRTLTIASPSGYDALYEFDTAKLEVGAKVWGADGYDIDGAIVDGRTGALDGVRYTTDRSRNHWFSPQLAEVQTLLDKAVGDRVATIASMSADQKAMIVHVGNADRPGSFYFYDAAAGGAMKRFAWVNGEIKGAALAPVSTFRYKARDGLSIEAVLTLPRGVPAKDLPLILMPHGGPAARDVAEYDWWAQFLADRGYAVVQPNYRGSAGYGRAFLEAAEGEWGLKMQDDLNDAVDDLVKRGIADAKRVCIVGASYGGYAAMRGAQRDGARFRCAVSYAGVSDLPAMLRYNGKFLNPDGGKDWLRRQAPDLKGVSPFNFPEQFSAPILIAHGKKDRRVPYSQSARMIGRLKEQGKAVEVLTQPLGDHFFSRQADRIEFLQALEAFLAKHNPA